MLAKTIKVYNPDDVTTYGENEVNPSLAGLQRDNVEAIWKSVVGLYKGGLHPALAICIRRHGQIVMNRTIGHIRGNAPGDGPKKEKVLATPDSLFNLFSASKVITAMLIHLLNERGQLHLDDAVEEYIPEFGTDSKRHITIRHVLTHRSGIPNNPGAQDPLDILTNREAVLKLIVETPPSLRPGRWLAYHALTGGFILGEIIHRITGQDPRTFLQNEILDPLGFDALNFGVAPERLHEVGEHAYTGPPPAFPMAHLLERSLGVDIREAVRLSNDSRFLTAQVPSGNVIGTANEACRFFELLLREGTLDGTQIFERKTVRRAIAETSYLEVDTTLMMPVRYSMGFMLGGDYLSFYGMGTPRAYGHLGFTNVLAYADPERDISVAFMNTGKPFLTLRLLKWLNVMRVISTKIPKI